MNVAIEGSNTGAAFSSLSAARKGKEEHATGLALEETSVAVARLP